MATKSPMKMAYGKTTPNVVGVSMGSKGKASETKPMIMKGTRSAGVMYKAPTAAGMSRKGKAADDKSTGNVSMMAQSASDKNRYSQAKQPEQYSNAGTPKKTKFLC